MSERSSPPGRSGGQPNERPWSVPLALADVPETGRQVVLHADDGTRAAVAKAAGVVGLSRLDATFDLSRHGSDGLRVAGRVAAAVTQHCVVTLDPVESEIDEAIDLVFTPQAAAAEGDDAEAGPSFHAVDSEEPPEALHDGVVDLGAIAMEFLILGIDPYPRAPGAVFTAPQPATDPASHPFAALAALKKGGGAKNQ